jgi:tRNA modification GTPase
MLSSEQTIIAPATPPGEGGIAILRISGNSAEGALQRSFRPSLNVSRLESHHLYHGKLVAPDGHVIDEVMAVLMRAPRTYTREDVAEIHCHGGSQTVRVILKHFLDSGLRLADPGEFTLRAFLHGRVDLARAEAVADLIRARSESARSVALGQMHGHLSTTVHRFREQVADLLALVEAHIDFPEDDIEVPVQQLLFSSAQATSQEIDALLVTFDSGRLLRDGLSVLIIGRPNVGKSSLLNRLLGESRAIVSDIPGTTRDTIEESLSLGGIPLRLIDTAGVRDSEHPVEVEGIRRSKEKIACADLVLLVVDGSRPLLEEDRLALALCATRRTLLVVNQADRPVHPLPDDFLSMQAIAVSAHTGTGMEGLRNAIVACFQGVGADPTETVMLSDQRHYQALLGARAALGRYLRALEDGFSPEFLALDLREALRALGEITGETASEDILQRIFSRFCIGK